MNDLLYRASFSLYEISFVLMALACGYFGLSLRKITRALHFPAYWIWPLLSAVMLVMCSFNHFYVYHTLSPQYLQTPSNELLVQMYVLKTLSMLYILGAGVLLLLGSGLYLRRISR